MPLGVGKGGGRVGVGVGALGVTGVAVGVCVGVWLGVDVGVWVGVWVAVAVGFSVGEASGWGVFVLARVGRADTAVPVTIFARWVSVSAAESLLLPRSNPKADSTMRRAKNDPTKPGQDWVS